MAVGVQVQTVLPPSTGDSRVDYRTLFLVGLAERGDTTAAIPIRSKTEKTAQLGNRVTYGALDDAIDCYFGEAGEFGGQVMAGRVVGPAATVGLLTLNDRAAVPVPTLRVDAKDAGAWSSEVTGAVADGALANTFTLTISFRGDVETFADLASPAAAVTALAASSYVRGTDLGSATVAPNNNPAVLAATALSAGNDDRAAVTAAMLTAALDRFGVDLGPGVVAIPGQTPANVVAGIGAHCAANQRVGLLAPAVGTTVAGAGTAARALRADANAAYLALIYPWVQIPDGGSSTRTVSPEGAAAGLRARMDKTYRAPAGQAGIMQFAVGAERSLTTDEINTLDADAVTSLRVTLGTVRLYGWRSLSLDTSNYRTLSSRDLLNVLQWAGKQALEPFVFRSIDGKGHLFAEVTNALDAICAPIAADDGLYAGPNDPGWKVDTGPAVNTPVTIANGEIRAELSVRLSPVGGLVRLTIRKAPLTGEL